MNAEKRSQIARIILDAFFECPTPSNWREARVFFVKGHKIWTIAFRLQKLKVFEVPNAQTIEILKKITDGYKINGYTN